MTNFSDLVKVFKRNYSDVLGVDVGASGTKVVRVKRINGNMALVAADILPAVSLSEGKESPLLSTGLPKGLRASYVALATSSSASIIKLLTFPPNSEKSTDDQVNELMGLGDNANFRIGYEMVMESRSENRVLAVALPDATARMLCSHFPEGVPAPCSIEVSGVAGLTAFQFGPGAQHQDECVAVIDCGAAMTLVAFFVKGSLVLIRKFDFGANNIIKKLQDNLGVDMEVAAGILNDGSFDVTRVVHQAMEHFLQQLIISWDYVERRENTRVGRLYAGGGAFSLSLLSREVEAATGQKTVVWDPLGALVMQPGALPERLKGQECRFSAAVGAALGILRQ